MSAWSAVWPPVGADLDARQEVAAAARILATIGFSENYAGHITSATDDPDRFWCTPWGLWWNEITASDVVLIDASGEVVDGALGVTPAVYIHTGLHHAREDARVVVHNHPPYGTLLASHGVLPEVFTQTGLILSGEMRLVERYTGAISTLEGGDEFAKSLLDGSAFLLANHGVITIGRTVPEAIFKAAVLEIVCRQAYQSLLIGRSPIPMPIEELGGLQRIQADISVRAYWDGALRALLRSQPEVLA